MGNIWKRYSIDKANRNSDHKLSTFSLHLHTPWLQKITSPLINTQSQRKRLVYPQGKANRYILWYVRTIVKLYLWQIMGRSELERSRWIIEVGIFHQGGPAVCSRCLTLATDIRSSHANDSYCWGIKGDKWDSHNWA